MATPLRSDGASRTIPEGALFEGTSADSPGTARGQSPPPLREEVCDLVFKLENIARAAIVERVATDYKGRTGSFFSCVHSINRGGWTALTRASAEGRTEDVSFLLTLPIDVNEPDGEGRVAVIVAAEGGYTEVMKLLHGYGADLHLVDRGGWMALTRASFKDRRESVRFLLTSRVGVDAHDRDGAGRIAVVVAAEEGYPEVMGVLCECGADPNHTDRDGWTALTRASFKGRGESVRFLLTSRVGVDADDRDGAGRVPIVEAAGEGHVKVMECLHEYGAMLDRVDGDGWTALTRASVEGQKESVRFLLNRRIGANDRDGGGRVAVVVAASRGHVEVVQLLCDRGADMYLADRRIGWTAFTRASGGGFVEVVAHLLDRGYNVNRPDQGGGVAVVQAATWEYTQVVELLCDRGADMYLADRGGWTAFTRASSWGRSRVVASLLARGCDPDRPDGKGRVAIVEASDHGCTDVVALLLSQGVDTDQADKKGRTALELASFHSRTVSFRRRCQEYDTIVRLINFRSRSAVVRYCELMGRYSYLTEEEENKRTRPGEGTVAVGCLRSESAEPISHNLPARQVADAKEGRGDES
ncbi:MAG: ankyrin repeat domain-containing protein [Simkaniaceae bacterium]|nr:ankyrin repeat domain-containing protein [Simkaniaceae bacterium]